MRSGLHLSIGKAAYNASIEAAIITHTNWQYHDYYGGLRYTYSGSATAWLPQYSPRACGAGISK